MKCLIHVVQRSVKELRDKVTDLETEVDRLSQALEAQTAATAEAQATGKKTVDEITRELQRKVRASSTIIRDVIIDEIIFCRTPKSSKFDLS